MVNSFINQSLIAKNNMSDNAGSSPYNDIVSPNIDFELELHQ